jgi:hypothetical protein
LNIINSTVLPQPLTSSVNQPLNKPPSQSTNQSSNKGTETVIRSSVQQPNSISTQTNTSFTLKPNQSLRFINVTSDGLTVAKFGQKTVEASLNRYALDQTSLNQSPQAQYQTNQTLLEREQIGQLVGIDLFA